MVELHPTALSLLDKRFNLLLQLDARSFDSQWSTLSIQLDKIKKESFCPNDRILITHMDTDYYDEVVPYGLLIINLLRMFKNKDIPLYVLLVVTNHYGIKKEFDNLLISQHKKDRPTVIETLLSPRLLSNNFIIDTQFDFHKIEKAGLSMMGKQRSHRVALCNFFVDSQLLDKIALTTNF